MRLRPSLELVIALCALGLLLFAVGWWWTTDVPVVLPEQPTWKGEAVQNVSAAVPTIGPFEREFNVNFEDPFVPLSVRIIQAENDRIRHLPPRHQHDPVAIAPEPVAPPPVPEIHWPAAQAHLVGPSCVGLISTSQGALLLVQMPNSTAIVGMAVGSTVPRDGTPDQQWTLLGVDADGLARFRDPTGSEELFPIGAPPTDPPPAAASDDTKPAATPGHPTPRNPNGAGAQLPPGFTGGQLQLPPGWQSRIPPGMQKEVQAQIMQQVMQMQQNQSQSHGGGK